MASVFLSYDREDAERAQPIAAALERAGHSVWWDRHIKGGAQFSNEIEQALSRADAVIVLWSARSISSAWVRDEAAAGRDNGRLVPVLLDEIEPPLGFRQYQSIDLSRWKRRGKSVPLQHLLDCVANLAAVEVAAGQDEPPPKIRQKSARQLRWLLWLLLFFGFVGVASATWYLTKRGPNLPIVAVSAADDSASAKTLARDLLVKLANFQSAELESVRLVEQGETVSQEADLIFEVGGSAAPGKPEANLVLLNGIDRTVLWSKDFQPPTGNPADLNQQLAYTAASVLACASEALNAKPKRLDQQTLKLYLNGCAELIGANPAAVAPIFLSVTEKAPRFEPGWAKLLEAETQTVSMPITEENKSRIARLRQHIASARRLNPALAAITLAEINLLPTNALLEKTRLIDQSLSTAPHNAGLLVSRAALSASVGRLTDSVQDAKQASQLEPLSPDLRIAYIWTLAHSGRTEAALGELEKAERIWPGASNIVSARFWLNLRYGNPKVALGLMRSGAIDLPQQLEAVVIAKIDPTIANVEGAKATIRAGLLQNPEMAAGPLQGYAVFGIEQELYSIMDQWVRPNPQLYSVLFGPPFREFRKDPRFMLVAKRAGLTDYWRATSKWPDFCFESGMPYDCKAEARKLSS